MWDTGFEEEVRRYLPFLPLEEELTPASPLRDLGLDSLGTVELLAALENRYDVHFVDDALHPENFTTPGALWRTLSGINLPV